MVERHKLVIYKRGRSAVPFFRVGVEHVSKLSGKGFAATIRLNTLFIIKLKVGVYQRQSNVLCLCDRANPLSRFLSR